MTRTGVTMSLAVAWGCTAAAAQETPNEVVVQGAIDAAEPGSVLGSLGPLSSAELTSLTGIVHVHAQRAFADAATFATRQATGAFGAPPNEGGVDRFAGFFPEGGVQYADFGGSVGLPSDAFAEGDGLGVWAAPYYVFTDNDGDASAPGYESEVAGVQVGYERAFEDGRAVGLTLGYANVQVRSDGGLGTADANLFSIGGFSRYARGPWRARVAAAYVYKVFDTERRLDLVTPGGTPLIATTDDQYADSFTAHARAAYRLGARPTALISAEPFFEASLGQYDREGFFEQGVGDLGLVSGDEDVLTLNLALGMQVQSEWEIGRLKIAPRLAGGFGAEALDRRTRTLTGFFGNRDETLDPETGDITDTTFTDQFVINSADLDRFYGFIGGGIEARLGAFALSAGYDGAFAGDRDIHVVKGAVGWRF